MTNQEIETIRNIVARLKEPNCGCSHGPGVDAQVEALQAGRATQGQALEVVSRIYLDTWVIPSLEMLLPEKRNPGLAVRMSRR